LAIEKLDTIAWRDQVGVAQRLMLGSVDNNCSGVDTLSNDQVSPMDIDAIVAKSGEVAIANIYSPATPGEVQSIRAS
jgi:hypothetical protein